MPTDPTPSELRPSPYVDDIRAQPDALASLLAAGIPAPVVAALRAGANADRIVLTGMGSSLHGMYPAYLRLVAAGLPVWLVDTADLLDADLGLVDAGSFVWVTSQSGEAAEVVELLSRLRGRDDLMLLGVTNDPASSLATSAHVVLPLNSGPEQTVSTRSYLNTLAASTLAVDYMLGAAADPTLASAPDSIAAYLEDWDFHLARIAEAVPDAPGFVLGRGAAAGTARMAGLTIKEAARQGAEGMGVAQFRHGPLEMAGPGVTVILVASDDAAGRSRDERMRTDVLATGARCVWLDPHPAPGPWMQAPAMPSVATRPLGDIVSIQLLTVVLAARVGAEPGRFRQIEKVTRVL